MTSVQSKHIFTVPNGFSVTEAMARTMPSPGTTMTFGATSTETPKPRMAHPRASEASCKGSSAGLSHESAAMLTSMSVLNKRLTATCRSWMGLKSRRRRATCAMMNRRFIAKVVSPKLSGSSRSST